MSGPVVDRLRAAGCVFAEDEAALLIEAAGSSAVLDALVERRCAGEPLEYILGWVEFGGRRLAVEAGVFVPRRRTEFLAVQAAGFARPGAIVLDLCCGVGAIGALVLARAACIELYASEIDPVAARCARRNLAGVDVFIGDLFAPLPPGLRGRVDVVVANVPYVPTSEIDRMPPEARDHEPRLTLDGGPDGLDVLRRVAAETPAWLAPGGRLLIEVSDRQAVAAANAFAANGLTPVVAADAERGATVVIGSR